MFVVILVITTLAFLFYYHHQPVGSYSMAPLMDGNQYLTIYHYLKGESSDYKVAFPFHSRVAIPWLATQLPCVQPVTAFQILNLIFAVSSAVALAGYWRQLSISAPRIGWGLFWLLFHWTGMIRLNAYDPVTVDVPLYLFQTLFLLIVYKRKWVHLWWLSPLATLQKESFPALLIVLFLYGWFYNRQTRTHLFPILGLAGCLMLSIATKGILNHFFPPTTQGNSVITILYFIKQTLLDPFRLIRWVTAVWVAFGGLFLLALQQWSRNGWQPIINRDIKKEIAFPFYTDIHTDLLFLFSVTYLGLSLLAGGDFTRIVFLGFPFLMTYGFLLVKNTRPLLFILSMLISIPLMHLTQTIPDQGRYWSDFAEWYPEFARPYAVWTLFGYGFVAGILLWILKRFQPSQ